MHWFWRAAAATFFGCSCFAASAVQAQTSQPAPAPSPLTTRPEAEVAARFDDALHSWANANPVNFVAAAKNICSRDCPGCTELARATSFWGNGKVDLDALLGELRAHPAAMSQLIKQLTHSVNPDRLDPVLRGTRRADIDFRRGAMRIEVHSGGPENLDWETGLELDHLGGNPVSDEGPESQAYNNRMRQLLAVNGSPPELTALRDRYRKSLLFNFETPKLEWVPLDLTKARKSDQQATVGPATLVYWLSARESNKLLWVKIASGQGQSGKISLLFQSPDAHVAYWPEPKALVFRFGSGVILVSGTHETFTFIDLPTMKETWTWFSGYGEPIASAPKKAGAAGTSRPAPLTTQAAGIRGEPVVALWNGGIYLARIPPFLVFAAWPDGTVVRKIDRTLRVGRVSPTAIADLLRELDAAGVRHPALPYGNVKVDGPEKALAVTLGALTVRINYDPQGECRQGENSNPTRSDCESFVLMCRRIEQAIDKVRPAETRELTGDLGLTYPSR